MGVAFIHSHPGSTLNTIYTIFNIHTRLHTYTPTNTRAHTCSLLTPLLLCTVHTLHQSVVPRDATRIDSSLYAVQARQQRRVEQSNTLTLRCRGELISTKRNAREASLWPMLEYCREKGRRRERGRCLPTASTSTSFFFLPCLVDNHQHPILLLRAMMAPRAASMAPSVREGSVAPSEMGGGGGVPAALRRLILRVFTRKYGLALHASAIAFIHATLQSHGLLDNGNDECAEAIEWLAKGLIESAEGGDQGGFGGG